MITLNNKELRSPGWFRGSIMSNDNNALMLDLDNVTSFREYRRNLLAIGLYPKGRGSKRDWVHFCPGVARGENHSLEPDNVFM